MQLLGRAAISGKACLSTLQESLQAVASHLHSANPTSMGPIHTRTAALKLAREKKGKRKTVCVNEDVQISWPELYPASSLPQSPFEPLT